MNLQKKKICHRTYIALYLEWHALYFNQFQKLISKRGKKKPRNLNFFKKEKADEIETNEFVS